MVEQQAQKWVPQPFFLVPPCLLHSCPAGNGSKIPLGNQLIWDFITANLIS